MLSEQDIQSSLKTARRNWNNWRNVYEYAGSVRTNPLLSEPGRRFAQFCKEYSVHRTIRAGTQNEFRLTLIEMLPAAIRDDSGQTLDQLECRVRPSFGTHNGTRRMISVISKVAAFVRPEKFVAWDRYAKKGLNVVFGRTPNASFESYADYLQTFGEVWSGELGDRIRRYMRKLGAKSTIEKEAQFQRRVLDVALMKCGGRKMS